MMPFDVSIGAIGAALITAMISLLSLIISKEQKVSDLRQIWIDDVRKEIVNYLTNVNSIGDASALDYKDHAEKVKALSPLYTSLNGSIFSIMLRINQEENHSKEIISCINRFNDLLHREGYIEPGEIRPIEKDLQLATKKMLKQEWIRVKRGEPTFRIAKIASVVVIVAILIGSAFIIIDRVNISSDTRAEPRSTILDAFCRLALAPAPVFRCTD